MATRNFAKISIEDLLAKIKKVQGNKHDCVRAMAEHLKSDIKVVFDCENTSDSPKRFGPTPLMGFHTESNGFTYCGMCAGGDWEHPVFFCVYWDGKKLRAYVPTEGNPWNSITKEAYGNDEVADLKDARKRWPDKFDEDTEEVESDEFEHDPELIRKDMLERILPPGQKAPVATKSNPVVAPIPRIPFPGGEHPVTTVEPNDKSAQERIESLTCLKILLYKLVQTQVK